jgi:hypothetical protein
MVQSRNGDPCMDRFEVTHKSFDLQSTPLKDKSKTLMQDLETIFRVSGLGIKSTLFKDVFEYCRNIHADTRQESDKLTRLLLKYNDEVVEFERELREILKQMPWQAETQCRKIEALLKGVGV